MITDLNTLPSNLPIPEDDGQAKHLIGTRIPSITLKSTTGKLVDLSKLEGWQVIYCYPLTGRPDVNLPENWDMIPGARGCTPQVCAFRDHHQELRGMGVGLVGVSVQSTAYQQEMVQRLHVPFDILSDRHYKFTDALRLPTMTTNGHRFLRRITLITHFGTIRHVNYPVFPPHEEPDRVIEWFKINLN